MSKRSERATGQPVREWAKHTRNTSAGRRGLNKRARLAAKKKLRGEE